MKSMSDKILIDSNIWLYAFMSSPYEKLMISSNLIDNTENIIRSTQNINEICVNLIRKCGYEEQHIQMLIKNLYNNFSIVYLNKNIILNASKNKKAYNFSYWDSLIISTAMINDCKYIYSEDMQNGIIVFEQIIIKNPFI